MAVAFTPVFEVSVGSGKPNLPMFEVCYSLKPNKTPPQNVKKSLFKCAFDADVKSKGPLFCTLRFDLAVINLQYCRHLFTPCCDWDPSTLKQMNNNE